MSTCPPCNGDCKENQGRGHCSAFPRPPQIDESPSWRERLYIAIVIATAWIGITLNIGEKK